MNAKNKMISFRLSDEEYTRLRAAAAAYGISNLSNLARTAVDRMANGDDRRTLDDLSSELRELRARLDAISQQLDRIHVVAR